MAVLLLLCEWEEKWTLPTQSLLNFRYSVSDNLGFSQQCDRLSDFFFSRCVGIRFLFMRDF